MEDFSYFQNQFVNRYFDGGASDGSCAMENYSSGDSTYSGEFASNPRPFSSRSSPSSNSESADRFNLKEYPFGGFYRGEKTEILGNSNRRSVGHNRQKNLRNISVTSPSPQQVSFKVEPFLHVGPPSPWQLRGWGQTAFPDDTSSPPPHRNFGFKFPQSGPCPSLTSFVADNYGLLIPSAIRSRAGQQPLLKPCNDPHCELRRNGRDVDLDDFDRMQISLRNGPHRQGAGNRLDGDADQEESPSLKYRLAQVRAMIREELAQEQASREARGLYGPRRRDRNTGKKCKFCLKKNEQPDIVSHHNLKDARGDVTCPILQQYRCDVCHATGHKAHTIKYCPLNNPDTPHDVILQARWKVYSRNRQREC